MLLTAATKVRDFAYFKAIHAEMEDGGYEAMLHDLLRRDLTGFDVRDVPETEGLQEQKKLSLGTADAWWMDVLHRGYVYKIQAWPGAPFRPVARVRHDRSLVRFLF